MFELLLTKKLLKIVFFFLLSNLLILIVNSKAVPVQSAPNLEAQIDQFQPLLSNASFLFSPEVATYDLQSFLESQNGPLKNYGEILDGEPWTAAEIIDYNAVYFGLNPQVIIVILEADSHLITNAGAEIPRIAPITQSISEEVNFYNYIKNISEQLLIAYDSFRYQQADDSFLFPTGESVSIESELNAATYAVQSTLSQILAQAKWKSWVQGNEPLFTTQYRSWFGELNSLQENEVNIASALPGDYLLPFPVGETWYYTGGPHHYYGTSHCAIGVPRNQCPLGPWSSIDIAPLEQTSCTSTSTYFQANRWIVAAKGGDVIKSQKALVVIDHGDGWLTYYSHVSTTNRRGFGGINQGDHIGHPSCEKEPNGFTNGVHVHFAIFQKNVGFADISGSSVSGWSVQETTHYNGTMTRNDITRSASVGRINGTNDILNSGVDNPCIPKNSEVALFVDSNFEGQCVIKGIGDYPNPASIGLPNDSISSIKFGGSVEAFFCRDDNFANVCETITNNDPDLSNNTIGNDQVSSVRIIQVSSDRVAISEHSNYGGTQYGWSNEGWFNVPDYMNDIASSIQIDSGWSARVFQHSNRNGGQKCYDSSDSDFINDTFDNGIIIDNQISSIEVFHQENCPTNDTVTIFEHPNYNGTNYGWQDEGWFNVPDYMNDVASSIWITNGWSARVFEHSNREGGQRCYNSNDSDLINDIFENGIAVDNRVSSIEIYHQENCPTTLPGDLDQDNDVDIFDYNHLMARFGDKGNPGFTPADIDRDGDVDIFDYNILINNYGASQTADSLPENDAVALPLSLPNPPSDLSFSIESNEIGTTIILTLSWEYNEGNVEGFLLNWSLEGYGGNTTTTFSSSVSATQVAIISCEQTANNRVATMSLNSFNASGNSSAALGAGSVVVPVCPPNEVFLPFFIAD